MLSAARMSDFSAGQLQTLMSVDADRVVNLCSSLHELWSLPLQILAALILLYTQVGTCMPYGPQLLETCIRSATSMLQASIGVCDYKSKQTAKLLATKAQGSMFSLSPHTK